MSIDLFEGLRQRHAPQTLKPEAIAKDSARLYELLGKAGKMPQLNPQDHYTTKLRKSSIFSPISFSTGKKTIEVSLDPLNNDLDRQIINLAYEIIDKSFCPDQTSAKPGSSSTTPSLSYPSRSRNPTIGLDDGTVTDNHSSTKAAKTSSSDRIQANPPAHNLDYLDLDQSSGQKARRGLPRDISVGPGPDRSLTHSADGSAALDPTNHPHGPGAPSTRPVFSRSARAPSVTQARVEALPPNVLELLEHMQRDSEEKTKLLREQMQLNANQTERLVGDLETAANWAKAAANNERNRADILQMQNGDLLNRLMQGKNSMLKMHYTSKIWILGFETYRDYLQKEINQ